MILYDKHAEKLLRVGILVPYSDLKSHFPESKDSLRSRPFMSTLENLIINT